MQGVLISALFGLLGLKVNLLHCVDSLLVALHNPI